jgi:hypothetical protein
LTEESSEDVECDQHEMKAAEHEQHHPRPDLPDPERGLDMCRAGALASAQGVRHLAQPTAIPDLSGDLPAGHHCMQQEEDADADHRRLRDVQIFETPGQRVEAASPRQDGAHQEHVAPHEGG